MAAVPRFERSCFGLDIGGTLCKISFFEKHEGGEATCEFTNKVRKLILSPEPYGETGKRDTELEFQDDVLGGRVYLMRFETRKMESFLKMVQSSQVMEKDAVVCCTGGGSRKYEALIKELLGLSTIKADELGCLVDGINFTLQRRMPELYRVDHGTFM
jgi:type II pantothenate kinase